MTAASRGAQRAVGETTHDIEACLDDIRALAAQQFPRMTVSVALAIQHVTDNWCRLRDGRDMIKLGTSTGYQLGGKAGDYNGHYRRAAKRVLDACCAEGFVVGTHDYYWPAGR